MDRSDSYGSYFSYEEDFSIRETISRCVFTYQNFSKEKIVFKKFLNNKLLIEEIKFGLKNQIIIM